MKKLISALFFSLAIVAIALGNGIDVPKKVDVAFKAKFPSADDVEWIMENGNYTAGFSEGDYLIFCSFDKTGSWTKTVTEIYEEDLPETITTFLKENFTFPSIVLVAKIETAEDISYSVSIEVEEESNDEEEEAETKEYTLIFDENGKIAKK
jgi:hypothetical protein